MLLKLSPFNAIKNSQNVLNLCFVIFLIIIGGCTCGKRITRSEIPEGESLPIDGAWSLSSPATKELLIEKMRIEKQRAFCVLPKSVLFPVDTVVFKNIKISSDDTYSATFIDTSGIEYQVALGVVSDSEITVRMASGTEWKLTKILLDNETSFLEMHKNIVRVSESSTNIDSKPSGKEPAASPQTSPKADNIKGLELITFNEEIVKAKEEERSAGIDSVLSQTWSREIETSVILESKNQEEKGTELEISDKAGLDFIIANTELAVKVKSDIKSKVEQNLGRTFKEKEIFTQTVTLDGGKKGHTWKLTWFDKVKTGIARYSTEDGKTYDIPYRIVVESKLDTQTIR
jgi:hypothetical protein